MKRAAVVYVLAAGVLFICSIASGQSASDPAPAEPPPAGMPSEPPIFEQAPSQPPSEPPPAAPPSEAPPSEPEPAESPPAGDKRPLRLYQTNDGVSVLSNRHDDPEPPPETDAGAAKSPPVEAPAAEPLTESAEVAPLPSSRPLAPSTAVTPPSRTPLFLLAAAVGIVALAIIAIFFRRK